MALSTLYKNPARLAQIYNCGPLSVFTDGFADYLDVQHFPSSTIKRHICAVEGLSLFCKLNSQKAVEDLAGNINHYLDSITLIDTENKIKSTRHGLNRFFRYMARYHGVMPVVPVIPYCAIYHQYQVWQKDIEQLKSSTIELRSNYLVQFLFWYRDKSDSSPLSQLSHLDVEAFIVEQTLKRGRAFKRSMQSTLREFLRFCFEKGFCQKNLASAVPKIRCYQLAQAPKAIPEQQAQKLLSDIDCTTDTGKRAYAIILLLYTYGVRSSQVRHLRLDDIDWHKGEIFFRAVKNSKSCRFPLSSDVGNALLDYLRNVRAQSAYPQVFLTMRAPFRPLNRSGTLSQITRTCMLKHQINSPSQGGHCFRHAFASRLLNQGAPFKHIADMLGHRYLSTTFIYTKIDFTSLAEVGLALPEV
jgi:site-specific recombinase XerD